MKLMRYFHPRRKYKHGVHLHLELLEDRTLPNASPLAPIISEPTFNGETVNPADVHMETRPFSDPDAGDTHVASDFEIWTTGSAAQVVWHAYNVIGIEKVHLHLGDGTFDNSYAGRTELVANTDYKLRVRHEDSSGDPATEWSPYAERLFHTSTPQPGIDTAWTVHQPGFVVEAVAHNFQLPVNIAFKPNAGPADSDVLFYVAELYGTIKAVHRDFSVSDYATNLLNFNPTGDFPGSGEQGLSGLAVDPVTGDVFASMVYSSTPGVESAAHYPKVVRFHSTNGGQTAATQTTILDMPGETQGQSHFISNVTIGPDGKLYVHNGDGFEDGTPLNLNSFRGKVLRTNLDGSAASDNPFYNAGDGISARDYIFAYGFRNPFGGAWRASDGQHYEVENGPSVDRFARVTRGGNYGFDGTDQSMHIGALYNWENAIAPVNVAFVQASTFGGSGFPAAMLDHAFVTQSGATWASGPQANAKTITEFSIDANGNYLGGPSSLIEYTGTGKATVAALAAGPDGLYFSDLYKDQNYESPIDRGANILRVRYVGTGGNNTNGLTASYFDDVGFTSPKLTRTDPTIDFDWGSGSPAAAIAPDTFAARWTGWIAPRYSETYTFRTTSDDGVRLWVNNQLIIDQWNDHATTEHTGTITLSAGLRYAIKMEYYESTGLAVVKLEWNSARQAREVVPQSQLFTDSTTAALPAAPSSLTASAASSTAINLSWQDNAANETGFRLERKAGSNGVWSVIASPAANITTYADSGLQPGTSYTYRVRAYNSGGESTNSNEASASPTSSGSGG